MTKIWIAIFFGGGLGSLMRYGIQRMIYTSVTPSLFFPWGTFSVNMAGSFFIGLFYILSERFNLSDETRFFLTTGLCGGFTTFSTFSHESINLIRQGHYTSFLFYVIASVTIGIAAAFAGSWTGTLFSNK